MEDLGITSKDAYFAIKTIRKVFSREITTEDGPIVVYFRVKAYKDLGDNIVIESLSVINDDDEEMDLIEEARDDIAWQLNKESKND